MCYGNIALHEGTQVNQLFNVRGRESVAWWQRKFVIFNESAPSPIHSICCNVCLSMVVCAYPLSLQLFLKEEGQPPRLRRCPSC